MISISPRTSTSTRGSGSSRPEARVAERIHRAIARAAFVALLLIAVPSVSFAQGDPAAQRPGVAATPVPWTALTPDEQRIFAPVREQWQAIPPAQQQRLRRTAERWQSLAPEQQDRIRQRLVRFAAMTPEQRAVARERFRAFQQLPPDEKQRIREAFRRYHALAPEERRQLRQRYESTNPPKP